MRSLFAFPAKDLERSFTKPFGLNLRWRSEAPANCFLHLGLIFFISGKVSGSLTGTSSPERG